MTQSPSLATAPAASAWAAATPPRQTGPTPLDLVVTGASGLVGAALLPGLVARGHRVRALSRAPSPTRPTAPGVRWTPYLPTDVASVAAAIDGADAVIHLAGHGLFDGRWTRANKERIRASRVDGTRALVGAISSLAKRPSVLVSASAVGWYGAQPPERTVDERDGPGEGFLAEVCQAWEAEASAATALGVRVAIPRLGVVLAREGGALRQMALPFKLFVGGPVGRGRQVLSWIHREDLVALLVAMVEDARWSGPANATAPYPESNRDFARALGQAMGRPALLPTPGLALRVALGEVASLVTTGQRVLPRVAEQHGFVFRYPRLADALADLYRP